MEACSGKPPRRCDAEPSPATEGRLAVVVTIDACYGDPARSKWTVGERARPLVGIHDTGAAHFIDDDADVFDAILLRSCCGFEPLTHLHFRHFSLRSAFIALRMRFPADVDGGGHSPRLS